MAARSNLQQAVPITFGYKAAVLLAGFQRHQERLRELRPRVLVGEFGGAAGNLSSLGTRGLEVQAGLMAELGLGQPEIAWHTMRDRIAEVGCFLGLVTGTLGKVSMDVKLMMQTEVEEVYEPFAEGRGSSSTMPQKRNPISSNYIHACVSMVRQNVAALLDAMVEDLDAGRGSTALVFGVTLLQYDMARAAAQRISAEPRLVRPIVGGDEDLNALLPERFFVLQDEARLRAQAIATAAEKRDNKALAESYGRLMETCVACHAAYLHRQ